MRKSFLKAVYSTTEKAQYRIPILILMFHIINESCTVENIVQCRPELNIRLWK